MSGQFAAILHGLGCSLAVASYRASSLVLVSPDEHGVAVLPRAFDKPMSVAAEGGKLAIALRRMGLYVEQRLNGRLVAVRGLVNRRAAEAGLWARGEFVVSRHVAPAAPCTEGAEAAKLGGYAAAAATAAPALQALAGVPVWIGVALVLAVAAVAVTVLMRRERAA